MTQEEQIKVMKNALAQIASMVDPEEMDTDSEGHTEWGCERDEAIEMAYENCITIAQLALGKISEA